MPEGSSEGASCRTARRGLPRRIGSARRRRLAWLLVSAGLLAARTDGEAADWFVDSRSGADLQEHGRQASSPVRTIGYAISLIEEDGDVRPRIRLAAGRYPGHRHGGHGLERLPLRMPAGATHVEIVGPVARNETDAATIVSLDTSSTIFLARAAAHELESGGVGFDLLRFSNLRLVGGKAGITVIPASVPPVTEAHGTIRIESSGFVDIGGNAVQVVSSSLWRLDATVTASTIDRCGGGVALHAGRGGVLRGEISSCHIRDLPAVYPGFVVGGAVDLHADSGATLEVLCERNHIRNPDVAFSLSTSNSPGLATITAMIRNNLVYDDPWTSCGDGVSRQSCGLQVGFLLGLWPRHALRVDVVNNTFHGIRTWPFFVGNSAALSELPGNKTLSVRVLNNIFWQTLEAGRSPTPLWNGAAVSVVPAVAFEHNTVPPSYRLASTNSSDDPLLRSVGTRDFSLSARSEAIDGGSGVYAPELYGALDLAGRCRIARSSGGMFFVVDRGAFERSGDCRDGGPTPFARGDCNDDGRIDVADPSYAFGYLFLGFGGSPHCFDACDSNDDGFVDIADPIYMLNFLFLGNADPPPPYPFAGDDPTEADSLPRCGSITHGI